MSRRVCRVEWIKSTPWRVISGGGGMDRGCHLTEDRWEDRRVIGFVIVSGGGGRRDPPLHGKMRVVTMAKEVERWMWSSFRVCMGRRRCIGVDWWRRKFVSIWKSQRMFYIRELIILLTAKTIIVLFFFLKDNK